MNPSLPELPPLPTAVVPVEAPTTLAPMLTGYSLADPGLSARDREVITERLRTRWAEILEVARAALSARSAEPVKPVAWMRDDGGQGIWSAEDKRVAESTKFGQWAELAKRYTIPLYSSPPSLVAGGGVPADEREAFEAWAAREGLREFGRQPLRPERYQDPDVEIRWQAWQARAALNAAHVLASLAGEGEKA